MSQTVGFATVAGVWSVGLLAELTDVLPTQTGPIASLGAVGVLIALVWYLVTKQGPKEREAAHEHTERIVGRAFTEYKEQSERQHEEVKAVVETMRQHVDQAGAACPHIARRD